MIGIKPDDEMKICGLFTEVNREEQGSVHGVFASSSCFHPGISDSITNITFYVMAMIEAITQMGGPRQRN
jgi:hypothetical protein